jgi:RNA polymerase sigma-70 factor (ECF subfamily)
MAHERDRIPTHRHDHTDLALVDAARRDRAAFGALYDRHVDRVFAYAMRRLRDRDLAADATANAFTRALVSIDRFRPDGESAFARWLMTIARNAVVDVVRERRGTVALDMDALARQRAASGADPARRLPPDDRRRVEAAIDALGSPGREIVVLRLQGWTGPEIAELLGMTHGAVRAAQHRAYGRLRESLAPLRPDLPRPAEEATS